MFNINDYVKVIEVENTDLFPVGTICKVSQIRGGVVQVEVDGVYWWYVDTELEHYEE